MKYFIIFKPTLYYIASAGLHSDFSVATLPYLGLRMLGFHLDVIQNEGRKKGYIWNSYIHNS